jgi:DNA-binding PadR family transcriptional regulator
VYDFFPGEQVAVRRIVYAPTESGEFELAALREYPAAFHEAAFEVNDRLVVFSARLSQRGQMRTAAAALQGWGAP